jgi:hypothetical protein
MQQNRPAGYAFLLEKYKLDTIPNWHSSRIAPTGTRSESIVIFFRNKSNSKHHPLALNNAYTSISPTR